MRFFAGTIALLLVAVLSLSVAHATPMLFSDAFNGPGLDPAWMQAGNLASHPGAIAGTYDMTHVNGDPMGGTKLRRSTTGTLSSYTHEIKLSINPFRMTGGGGTQSDFKWKSFGSDGFMELVLNSFGDMRLFHNNTTAGSNGTILQNGIGYMDGDDLVLTTVYDQGTDTIDVSYSLNGGPSVNFFAGTGNGGFFGDVITGTVEAEVFKWGSNLPDQPLASIDSWSLVPEPASAGLLGIAGLFLISCVRRGRSR